MTQAFELAKYKGKWAVFDSVSRTFSYIGRGKRVCLREAQALNELIANERGGC